jgi:hypothetical protein
MIDKPKIRAASPRISPRNTKSLDFRHFVHPHNLAFPRKELIRNDVLLVFENARKSKSIWPFAKVRKDLRLGSYIGIVHSEAKAFQRWHNHPSTFLVLSEVNDETSCFLNTLLNCLEEQNQVFTLPGTHEVRPHAIDLESKRSCNGCCSFGSVSAIISICDRQLVACIALNQFSPKAGSGDVYQFEIARQAPVADADFGGRVAPGPAVLPYRSPRSSWDANCAGPRRSVHQEPQGRGHGQLQTLDRAER